MYYKLKCECGFVSNVAGFGAIGGLMVHNVPVYVPGDETLHTIRFEAKASETRDEFYDRIEAIVEESVKEKYGEYAIRIGPHIDSGHLLTCPKCGKRTARVVFAGF